VRVTDPGRRPTPFDAVFAPWAAEKFGALREALRSGDVAALDRDAFLMARPVIELIRDLRPGAGLGEAMDEFIALIHAAYLFWEEGQHVVQVDEAEFRRLVGEPPPGPGQQAGRLPSALYVQYPQRRAWGAPVAGGPHEPLDGCFVVRIGGTLHVVGIFGFHPGRDGFSVVAVSGPRPRGLRREDDSPLFSPVLPGGGTAGLSSVTGMEELLELAWRSLAAD
jgi:hypothetical protein